MVHPSNALDGSVSVRWRPRRGLTFTDISERKHAEEELRAAKEVFGADRGGGALSARRAHS
jgi:hypothetical protein